MLEIICWHNHLIPKLDSQLFFFNISLFLIIPLHSLTTAKPNHDVGDNQNELKHLKLLTIKLPGVSTKLCWVVRFVMLKQFHV